MPNQELRRARITSIILGLAATLSVVFFLYALQQRSRADQLQMEVDLLMKQLESKKSVGDSILIK